jgi:hypothetical protein
LRQRFKCRFNGLDIQAAEISFFQNPLDCYIEKLAPKLQMEITGIQFDDMLKEKFNVVNLINFHKCLPETLYPKARSFAHSSTPVSGATYICKKKKKLSKNEIHQVCLQVIFAR